MGGNAAFYKFTLFSIVMGVVVSVILVLAGVEPVTTFLIAFLICYALTGSNFYIMNKRKTANTKTFFGWFVGSFMLRFFGAIIVIIICIKILNFHEILFTVSFIFSYLCLSIIEIIYLNSILKTDA